MKTKKIIAFSLAGVIIFSLVTTTLYVNLNRKNSDMEIDNNNITSDVIVSDPKISDIASPSALNDESTNIVNIDVSKIPISSDILSTKPSISKSETSADSKTPTVNKPAVTDSKIVNTPSKGGVVSVVPIFRPDEPVAPSGSTPQASDWISVNPDIPQALYNYDYTVIKQNELLTGKMLEYRGFTDWDKAVEACIGALTTYYTVDYQNISSTNPNDKDPYLKSLVYWVGESAQIDICDYMQFIKDNNIISTASVVTDRSLIYNNGRRLIRARVYVTFQSGASAYGLQNNVKYYKDVEVAVYASTGENRYGYGPGADFNALLFSDNCFNTLCSFTKA